MSQHPPERITPLPWRILVINSESVSLENERNRPVGALKKLSGSATSPEELTANAAYIVHCANNYPKLEALNMELVEALEFVLENYGVPSHIYDSGRHKAIVETLQKAKGG